MTKNQFTYFLSAVFIIFSFLFVFCLWLYPFFADSFFLARHPLDNNKLFGILYGHGVFAPFRLFWVFVGGITFSNLEVVLVSLLVFLFFFEIFKIFNSKFLKNHYVPAILIFLISLFFYRIFLLEVAPSKMFGDAAVYYSQIEKGMIFGSSALTDNLFILVRNIFYLSGFETMQFVNVFFGGVFSVIVYFLALTLGKTSFQKIVLFLGIVFSGYSMIFFGYPETTAGVLSFIAAYVLFSIRYLRSAKKSLWVLVFAFISLSIACLLHNAALTLGLSVISLSVFSLKKSDLFKTIIRFLLALLIVVMPFLVFIVYFYYSKGNFGNATGGGDHSMFVPLYLEYTLNSLRPYYSFFSYFHFSEILSSMLLSAPLFFVVIWVFFVFNKSLKFISKENDSVLIFLSLLALGTSVIPVFWHFDFGAFGDWNLVTTYFIPLNVLSWYLVSVLLTKVNEKNFWLKFSVFCLLFFQYSMVSGLVSFFEK